MRLYYEPCGGNYGDMFTKFFIETTYATQVDRARPKDASLVAAGSILQNIPHDWTGDVVGTGFMFSHNSGTFPRANVRLVRGPLTAERIGVPDVGFGDLGLLAREYLFDPYTPSKHFEVGVVPHYVDKTLKVQGGSVLNIDIMSPPLDFIHKVAKCEHIVTSSLHGIITADSLGIPRTWVPHPKVLGDGFKFHDYNRSLGLGDLEPKVKVKAPVEVVSRMSQEIRNQMNIVMRNQ